MIDTLRKTLDLFSPRERVSLAGIFLVAVLTALLATSSVASIMPFMAVVADPGIVETNPFLAAFHGWVDADTRSGFLVVLGLAALCVLVASSGLSALTAWLTHRFVWRKHDDLSSRLFSRYVHQPYSWFLHRNTSHLSKNLLNEAAVVARGVLVPVLDLSTRGVVALFILGFLVYLDPLLAGATALVLGGGYLTLWTLVRDRQRRIGREHVDLNTVRFRLASEAFGGIKELKVLGREEAVVDRFRVVSGRFSAISTAQQMVVRLPRHVMEVVAFGGILLVAVYLLATRAGIGEALPVLSAFALGGYKLMPTLQGVFDGLATVRFNAASLDDVHADLTGTVGMVAEAGRWGEPVTSLREEGSDSGEVATDAGGEGAARSGREPATGPSRTPNTVPAEPASGTSDGWQLAPSPPEDCAPLPLRRELRLSGLTYAYSGTREHVLRGVDLEIRAGESVGLVGATGSGKTTVVDLILGLLTPPADCFLVDGEAMTPERLARWRRSVGYVPQEIFLSDESAARNIALGLPDERIDAERVRWAARLARIDEFLRTLPEGYDTVVGERGVRLSGGQRQRIGIARALYDDRPVLILDEGTSALDGATEAAVTNEIRALEPRKTIVWIAHRLRSVEECDRIYVLEDGRVAARGTYDELLRTDERFRAMARAGGAS